MAFNIFAMPSSSIILLLSAVFGISHALPWPGAQETKVYRGQEWSPAPTAVPVNPAELFKRSSVGVNTCGWVGGNSAAPAVCSPGSSCIHDTIHGYVGCCATEGPCTAGVYTSCVDKNSAGWSPNSGMVDNGIYTCNGDDVCYRNTYPGGYYQYGCGASNWGTTVATTYSGQPSDLLLQIVYTGVNFTPTSAIPTTTATSSPSSATSSSSPSSKTTFTTSTSTTSSTSSSISPSQTLAGNGTSTASAANSGTSTNTKTIIGASVGGVVAVVAALALALMFWRRRNNKKREHYAGPFISSHARLSSKEPSIGPFTEIRPYGPDDFGVPRETTRTPLTYQYAAISGVHDSSDIGLSSPPREEAPLVSEIDDFSQSYNNAVNGRDDETASFYSSSTGQPPDTVTGMGLGVGASRPGDLRRDGSGSSSNSSSSSRTQRPNRNRNLTGQTFDPQNEGWEPQRLRTRDSYMSGNGTEETMKLRGGGSGNNSPELIVPPKSPLRPSVRFPRDNRPRYELVDEVPRDDVPILRSPGQRVRRSGNFS